MSQGAEDGFDPLQSSLHSRREDVFLLLLKYFKVQASHQSNCFPLPLSAQLLCTSLCSKYITFVALECHQIEVTARGGPVGRISTPVTLVPWHFVAPLHSVRAPYTTLRVVAKT